MPHDHSHHSMSEAKDQPGAEPKPGWVNVIFRGLFLFVERPRPSTNLGPVGYVEAVIPDLGSEHVYRAGDFLAEETLQQRGMPNPYLLLGVEAGGATFDDTNIVLRGFEYDAEALTVYARVVVPMPVEIISLRPMEEPYQTLFDSTSKIQGFKTNSVHVFRYPSADLKKVSLRGHMAPLTSFTWDEHDFLNLHVISEPDHCPGSDPHAAHHTVHGFHSLISLIPKLQGWVELVPGFETKVTKSEANHPNKGFAGIETSTVGELQSFLSQEGRYLRSGESSKSDVTPALPPFSCAPLVICP